MKRNSLKSMLALGAIFFVAQPAQANPFDDLVFEMTFTPLVSTYGTDLCGVQIASVVSKGSLEQTQNNNGTTQSKKITERSGGGSFLGIGGKGSTKKLQELVERFNRDSTFSQSYEITEPQVMGKDCTALIQAAALTEQNLQTVAGNVQIAQINGDTEVTVAQERYGTMRYAIDAQKAVQLTQIERQFEAMIFGSVLNSFGLNGLFGQQ
jgi:hypothetical protein